jgi:hypothetical protein
VWWGARRYVKRRRRIRYQLGTLLESSLGSCRIPSEGRGHDGVLLDAVLKVAHISRVEMTAMLIGSAHLHGLLQPGADRSQRDMSQSADNIALADTSPLHHG